MKKKFLLLMIAVTFASSITPAHASTKSIKLIAEFKKFLTSNQSEYSNSIKSAESQYQPLIASAQQKIQSAISDLKTANKVRVIKLGNNRSYWGQFDCPSNRLNCIGVDKGPEFQVGEQIAIKEIVLTDLDQLYVMQLILADGLVELLSPSLYLNSVDNFRSANRELVASIGKLNQAKMQANQLRLDNLEFSEAIRVAILSAKRADKTPADFDRAFSNAFIFEYNLIGLNNYASTPFSQINSLKALDNVIEITKLSAQADAVASSYNYKNANRINKICGRIFIGESKFISDFSFISGIYQSVARVKLSSKV